MSDDGWECCSGVSSTRALLRTFACTFDLAIDSCFILVLFVYKLSSVVVVKVSVRVASISGLVLLALLLLL